MSSDEVELYPEHPLANRLKLAWSWIPEGAHRLLDAGCSSGYATRHYAQKARETWGIDPDEAAIRVARARYPSIHFERSSLETMPFPDRFFDVVVMADVLEHVQSEVAALNEIHRVTGPGATLILTTPHAGLFAWLDPYNYGHYLRKHLPRLYRLLSRTASAGGRLDPGPIHRHYRLSQIHRLFRESKFRTSYEVTKTFRSGCFLFPFKINASLALERALGPRRGRWLASPFQTLSEADFWIPCGSLAYNVALRLKRTG